MHVEKETQERVCALAMVWCRMFFDEREACFRGETAEAGWVGYPSAPLVHGVKENVTSVLSSQVG